MEEEIAMFKSLNKIETKAASATFMVIVRKNVNKPLPREDHIYISTHCKQFEIYYSDRIRKRVVWNVL